MAEIFRSTLRARGGRAALLVLLLFLALSSAVMSWSSGDPNPTFVTLLASIYAIVTGAGLIGNDVSDGTVQLVLGRPLTRNQYLAGRALGAAALAVGGGLFILAAGLVGILLHGPVKEEWGLGWLALTLVAHLLWQVAFCFALSTVVPGRGDVVLYLLLVFSSMLLVSMTGSITWPWLSAFLYWWREQVDNGLVFVGGPSPLLWQDLARWSSNLVAVLFLGALAFYRKEFSYGAG